MKTKETKRMLLIVISNLFMVFLGIGLVIPVMPTFMHQMSLSGQTMGYLVAAYAMAQLVFSPIAGRLSDLFGRKRMIVIGMVIFALSEFIFGIGHVVSLLYLSRILGGLSAALIFPSVMAFVADITTLEERPKAMGWVSGAVSGGFIIGPGIGGFLGDISTRLPFYVAAILGLVGFIFAFIFLKEPEHEEASEEVAKTSLKEVILTPALTFPFLIILINAFGLAAFESIYSIYVDLNFGFSVKDIAVVITASGVFALIAQLIFFDPIVRKIGEVGLIRLCLLASSVFVLAMIFAQGYWSVLICTFVIFLAFDLIRPAITTFLSKHAGSNQGSVSGINSALTSVGNIVGPILSGTLLDMNTHYPYYVVVVILAISFVLTLMWKVAPTKTY
ncbi:MFS transporter [Vagococcus intermedius]|uniref:MFS transporter n=1 Tax=Vagococcus intermedius TaxID=2991418 RepID=A0AAF0CW35_9ENTE|nr:MFS transporter [Vagococcus intermedius]WEG73762.1 MFS transporter [Vagococcus intermedius]WEG75847.1 MFS transporter [Vagococcus intermedius]